MLDTDFGPVNNYMLILNRASASRRVRRVGQKKSAFRTLKIKVFDAIALKATRESHVVSNV